MWRQLLTQYKGYFSNNGVASLDDLPLVMPTEERLHSSNSLAM